MKKKFKYLIVVLGFTCVLLFGVGASANMNYEISFVGKIFSEPLNMLLQGGVLMGIAGFMKSWKGR